MEYFLIGSHSYAVKEDLKAFGCSWDKERKCWKTIPLEKDEIAYKRIKSLCQAFSIEMVPVRSTHEHVSKIQEILNNVK